MAVKISGVKSVEEKLHPGSAMQNRSPIVVVLGHVDHGKTTLLDRIRKANTAQKEAGGITQHIGAYQIEYQGKKITFIDTPGHVAFSKMRSRGAKIADLAVLVVAANEGVMPQTLESLKHIITAKIPYLVAINKIDLPEVKPDWLKKNLAENEIFIEGYGGKIVAVSVSAKSGKGINQLLEMILLLGEMAELKADPEGKLEAVVIESRMDSRKGPVASVLVRNGSLCVGEKVKTDGTGAKIKAMFDQTGKPVKIAQPGQPVEVLGFTQLPEIGAKIISGLAEKKISKAVKAPAAEILEEEKEKLKIILKADVIGTLEAILGSLPNEVKIISSGVGNISDSDVLMAGTTGAEIIGFNVKTAKEIEKLAETEGVKIKTYKIIYELLQDMEKKVLKIMEPTIDEKILGQAEIIAEFEIDKKRIAGAKVKTGVITKKDTLHLKRGAQILADCRIKSLKKGKLDVEKVKESEEFGAILSPSLDFTKGDVLISFSKAAD